MKTIHKFPIPRDGKILLPMTCAILSAGMDADMRRCVWVMVDTDCETTTLRKFHLFATGQIISVGGISFVGTIFDMPYVWHVFVEGSTGGLP